MAYRRISKKQVAYLESMASQLDVELPWGYQATSSEKAAVLIRKLQKQLNATPQDDPPQLSLL